MDRSPAARILLFAVVLTQCPFVSAQEGESSATADVSDGVSETASQGDSSFWDRFIDPEDGRFDVTAGGESGAGFLPIAIPFNEPTFGTGLVAAGLYFHPTDESDSGAEAAPSGLPPTMSFGGVAFSDEDSWVLAGGHAATLRDGDVRYLGVVGTASINLDFYGIDGTSAAPDDALGFNIDGEVFVQQAQFALGETRLAAGLRYTLIAASTTFDLTPDFEIELGETTDAGLTAFINFDSRDNVFTPSAGAFGRASLSYFSDSLGGDFDYSRLDLAGYKFWQLKDERLSLGLRAQFSHAGGDAPFYSLPWVTLRGVPALRYLGNYALTFEVEPRWKIDERWSVLGFTGIGRASEDLSRLDDSEAAYNYGFGFRYLIARQLGLAAGFDIARGPEESILAITIGSAWGF